MILYLDTSAIVKLFVRESDSEVFRETAATATGFATSLIAYPETRSALARRRREGSIGPTEYTSILGGFEAWWDGCLHVELTSSTSRLAGELAERLSIRALDSIHLASALSFRVDFGDPIRFGVADLHLRRAAVSEGLQLM
jgi:predicted nucleic acid-binding protein